MGVRKDPHRLLVLLAGLAAAAALVAGCGDDEETSDEQPSGETKSLAVPDEEPAEVQALSTEAAAGEYDEGIETLLYLLDDYWADALPEAGFEYASPSDVIAYYPPEDTPTCGGQPLGPGNAFYCPADDTIAWDEPGLMIPFYEEVGDAAVGFILAHEWGHLVQNRLGLQFKRTIESELNADCLAGDFAGAMADEGLLEGGESLEPGTDLAEAADGIFAVGDPPSVPWQDPQAHGTGEQRIEAFAVGYDEGAEACVDEYGPGSADA